MYPRFLFFIDLTSNLLFLVQVIMIDTYCNNTFLLIEMFDDAGARLNSNEFMIAS